MAFAKRIVLFLLLNILVVTTLSVIASVLGIRPYLNAYGLDYEQLAAFALLWGMGGAFISLALSRIMAKWMMGVRVIDPRTNDVALRNLVFTVHELSRKAGLSTMPEVGIYDSPELNAFATGPTKSRSLVAVSTGLLQRMDQESVEGVLGHEVAHIANGDMVTMTLIQGVVNAFVIFLSRVIAWAIAQALRGDRDDNRGGGVNYMVFSLVSFALEIVFMIAGSVVVAWFSRQREYRADQGGAKFAGRGKMIRALESLQKGMGVIDPNSKAAVDTLKISGKGKGIFSLFSTHPPLTERIRRLQTSGL